MRKKRQDCAVRDCKGADAEVPYSLNQCRLCWKWLNPGLVVGRRPRDNRPLSWFMSLDCAYRGPPTGDKLDCRMCGGRRKSVAVYECSVHGSCTTEFHGHPGGPHCCLGCREKTPADTAANTRPPRPAEPESIAVKWSYGVTTVPQRRDDLLPRTLASLKAAGFDRPRLFVDGCRDGSRSWEDEFGLDVTARGGPNLRTAGNWVCSMYELFYRDPEADYFALFQDDFVCSLGLRRYLEENPCPTPGYMNLLTFPRVQRIAPKTPAGGTVDGWFKSLRIAKGYSDQVGREVEFQIGLGAVALVFTREGVMDLLGSRELSGRPLDPKKGHRSIDGGIVHCMNKLGYDEYVHSPSLVQHTGERSSMGNKRFPPAESFRGEKFDLLTLIGGKTATV